MRIVRHPDELSNLLAMALAEAQAAFGDDRVYLEKFLPQARHVEIQVVADKHGNVIHLGTRLPGAAAPSKAGGRGTGNRHLRGRPAPPWERPQSAGPGPPIIPVSARWSSYYAERSRYYFLEINTRIQVEHPVTEMVTGIDLVKTRLKIAAGKPLNLKQEDVRITGHVLECPHQRQRRIP